MGVERQDGIITSLVKTRNPIAILHGIRTWSPVTEHGKPIVQWSEQGPEPYSTRKTYVKAWPESVREESYVVRRAWPYTTQQVPKSFFRSEVNEAQRPWSDKLRWTDPSAT